MAIHDSAKSLEKTLNKLLEGFTGDCMAVLKKEFFDVGKNIIATTPFDTGRARKGWIASNDSPSNDKPPADEYPEMQGSSPEMPRETVFDDKAKSWWWANNVEYIMDLEGGHSTQRPNGFVAIELDRVEAHLAQALAKVKFK